MNFIAVLVHTTKIITSVTVGQVNVLTCICLPVCRITWKSYQWISTKVQFIKLS